MHRKALSLAISAAASSVSRMHGKYKKIQITVGLFSSLSAYLFHTGSPQFKDLLPAWSKRGALPLTLPVQLLGNTRQRSKQKDKEK